MKKLMTLAVIMLLALPLAARYYRSHGVTVSGYDMVYEHLYVFCEVWDTCESGRFKVRIDYGTGRTQRTKIVFGRWHDNATSTTLRVRMFRGSEIYGVGVVGVWPDC